MAFDKRDVQFWRDLKPGSFITLTDAGTINDALESGGDLSGRQFEVRKIIHIDESNKLLTWRFFVLESAGTKTVWLLAKIVDQDFDLRVLFVPDDFDKGDRHDQIGWEHYELFQKPEDPDNIVLEELEFATSLHRVEGGEEDKEREIEYALKGQGELNGDVTEIPTPSGVIPLIATVAEYSTDDETENPEAILLEIGNPECETGGLIRLLLGSPVSLSDVDIIAK